MQQTVIVRWNLAREGVKGNSYFEFVLFMNQLKICSIIFLSVRF